jgi:hypothetical protein
MDVTVNGFLATNGPTKVIGEIKDLAVHRLSALMQRLHGLLLTCPPSTNNWA